ncbi:MAG: organomercurial lyase, partial [Alphaproteobacteria bacterium]
MSANAPGWLDRSAVTSKPARRALAAIVESFDIRAKWSGLDAAEDRVRRAVLVLYARLGRAPAAAEIAAEAGVAPDAVGGVLARLEARDILRLDAAKRTILGAYPFAERESGHRVSLGDHTLNAMCSIDALGVGAMCRRDVTIASACRGCGAAIDVATGDDGTALARVSPPGALVWAALHYA